MKYSKLDDYVSPDEYEELIEVPNKFLYHYDYNKINSRFIFNEYSFMFTSIIFINPIISLKKFNGILLHHSVIIEVNSDIRKVPSMRYLINDSYSFLLYGSKKALMKLKLSL